ncbi:MAG: Gfo/Idh/MocA family oxidoreductase [Candidatus Brocadiaceae bacterium]|nr:Gfo/Idh/MocA family oxidoreductase [Candidatus Brocadiaceae bacterium]
MGISLGLVGLGSFGSQFAELFKRHPLVDRMALCDVEPERVRRFADREDWRDKFRPSDAYAAFDDICVSDLDALVVITQPWLHAPQCLQALESGKHVYSAVPIISVPDDDEILDCCDRLVSAVQRTGLHYMLGETTCYRPATMYCRRRAAAGDFGRFVHSDAQYLHDVDDRGSNLREVQRRRTTGKVGSLWLAEAQRYAGRGLVGGPMHYPTHSFSGPIHVMGARVARICAWGQRDETGDDYFANAYMNEVAFCRMSNGATARVAECRRVGHTGEETFRIFGTEGSFREDQWVTRDGWTALTVDDMRDVLPDEVVDAFRGEDGSGTYGGHGGSHAYLVHEFVDAVAHDRVPAVNVWEAVRYMAAGVTAHKSVLADGEVLDVPDWGDAPK